MPGKTPAQESGSGQRSPSVWGSMAQSLPLIYSKSPWFILVLFIILLSAILIRWDSVESSRRIQKTNNAYIHFDTISLEAKVTGYVRSVSFSDFQSVNQNGVLITLEDGDYRMAVMEAEAKRDYAAASLKNLELEVRLQQANVDQAKAFAGNTKAKLDLAARENDRISKLVKQGAVAIQEADTVQANLKAAEASHKESEAMEAVQERKLDILASEKSLRQANLKAAEAALEAAKINLGHTRIKAPISSYAGACKIRVGELVKLGTPVVTLIPDAAPYIIANYKETQLTHIKPGQSATITVDTFPGQPLKGRVTAISPATGATFSLLPKDNSSGNFTKVVQRIPVRIELAPDQALAYELRAGMSVTTSIDTEGEVQAENLPRQAGNGVYRRTFDGHAEGNNG